MTYQRNSVFHFICYWLRFAFAIWFQLPYYAWRRKRYSLLYVNMFASTTYLCVVCALYQWKPVATFWVFIATFITTSFALMYGNWCQHILIDPTRFDNSYAITYNIINTPMNKLTYNDGYHIVHHINSQLHWSKLPEFFWKNKEKFYQNNALTFEGLDFATIGLYLFTERYELLAKHYVHLGPLETKKSTEELVQQFKEWLQPIPTPTEINRPPPKKSL